MGMPVDACIEASKKPAFAKEHQRRLSTKIVSNVKNLGCPVIDSVCASSIWAFWHSKATRCATSIKAIEEEKRRHSGLDREAW